MVGLLDWLKIGSAALAGAILVSGPLYLYGKHEGRSQAAVAALEKSVSDLRQRNKIDENISASDAAALCRDFGLSDEEQRECMRRIQAANSQP